MRESLINLLFSNPSAISTEDSAWAREKAAGLTGLANASMYMIFYLIVGIFLASVTIWVFNTIAIPLMIASLLVLIIPARKGFDAYKKARRGTELLVPNNYKGILRIGGERMKAVLKEGVHEALLIVLPFNLFPRLFEVSHINVPMKKRTYDDVADWLLSEDLMAFEAKLSLSVWPLDDVDNLYKRSGYTDEDEKVILMDELVTGFNLALTNLNVKDITSSGDDVYDNMNKEWHNILANTDLADIVRDPRSGQLIHTVLGVRINPLLRGRRPSNPNDRDAISAPARATAEGQALRIKFAIVNEFIPEFKRLFPGLSDREIRNTIMVMTNEYAEEKFIDFGGFSGIENIPWDKLKEVFDKIKGKLSS